MIVNEINSRIVTNKMPVLVVCGPTASGKSALAIRLAQKLTENGYAANGAEIVSADSMQIYRDLNIGTAKVTKKERNAVKHHMIDICAPEDYYSVAQYKKDATAIIKKIVSEDKLAIVCGGTGQYLSALLEGITYIETPVDHELRRNLNAKADNDGLESMLMELQEKDPEAAAKLSVADRKRIIRAHEIIAATGKTPTDVNRESKLDGPDFSFESFCLSPDRELLYQRINNRTKEMLSAGWIDETRALIENGLSPDVTSMQAIGYRQIIKYLQNEISIEDAISQIQQATRRYAKRQLTWFRRMHNLRWICENDSKQASKIIIDYFI